MTEEKWSWNKVRRGCVEVLCNDVVMGRVGRVKEARRICAQASSSVGGVTGAFLYYQLTGDGNDNE